MLARDGNLFVFRVHQLQGNGLNNGPAAGIWIIVEMWRVESLIASICSVRWVVRWWHRWHSLIKQFTALINGKIDKTSHLHLITQPSTDTRIYVAAPSHPAASCRAVLVLQLQSSVRRGAKSLFGRGD